MYLEVKCHDIGKLLSSKSAEKSGLFGLQSLTDIFTEVSEENREGAC